MSLKDKYAFIGLGVTKQGKIPEKNVDELAAEAILLALEDSGLRKDEVDGYIFQEGIGGGPNSVIPLQLAGIPSKLCWSLQTQSCTGISSIAAAIGVLEAGFCENCIILHSTSAASKRVLVGEGREQRSTAGAYGWYGPAATAACMARRQMHLHGLTKEQMGAVSLTQRDYANMRPDAYMHERKMTMEDYLNSRMIVEPLGMFDCCLVTDGAVAQIITRSERAKYYKKPPVYIMGIGLDHSIREIGRSPQAVWHWDGFVCTKAKENAFKMAEVNLRDVDVAEMYDAFTPFLLSGLEAYGICAKGEAGPFVAEGNLGLNGSFPCNTSGGELSWGYLQGFTQTTEGIRQMRGEGGATQIRDAEICLCTGLGGGPFGSSAACAILRR
jgi:acetyl-CoA acetyltransferase